MNIRGATNRDMKFVDSILKEYDFNLDPAHLEFIAIAEDDDKQPVAVMALNTVLECTFMTVKKSKKRDKIEALKRLVDVGKHGVRGLRYEMVHAFANGLIAPILKKHFEFKPAKGENLVLFVDKGVE